LAGNPFGYPDRGALSSSSPASRLSAPKPAGFCSFLLMLADEVAGGNSDRKLGMRMQNKASLACKVALWQLAKRGVDNH
jgi:hypothetical protein